MEKTAVQRLANVLRVLILTAFVLNLLCLLLVPLFAMLTAERELYSMLQYLRENLPGYPIHTLGHVLMLYPIVFQAVWYDWRIAVLTLFFWLCGICTALILWQAKRVLDTILEGNPFRLKNARALNRAAVCCWVISGVALMRLIWWLSHDHSAAPFFTYNTLFVPAFLIAGLLFQVMSALFRQAAELKEDQDLTI